MSNKFDTLLLLALPASGKSEVREFLSKRDPEQFHMGDTVQLDDYPYVHLQIRTDEELEALGLSRIFHAGDGQPFANAYEWGALLELIREDYAELHTGKAEQPENAARRLFERFDQAAVRAGGEAKMAALPADVLAKLEEKLEAEARKLFDEKVANVPASLEGKTIVIEFARGGPEGASFPLPEGYGYQGSLPHLGADLLSRAAVLYIWVTPEESRRKNRARARPDGQGTSLFHGTPEPVMFQEYGCDDMAWLIENAPVPGTIRIESEGKTFDLPVARFDNRSDLTTFLREDSSQWKEEDIEAIHSALKEATAKLWKQLKG